MGTGHYGCGRKDQEEHRVISDEIPHITAEKRYEWGESNDWIEGFYTGMIWLCYEYTKDPLFRDTAIAQLEDYKARLEEKRHLDHHDIGFLYLPSALASWIVDEHKEGKQLALKQPTI